MRLLRLKNESDRYSMSDSCTSALLGKTARIAYVADYVLYAQK